MSIVLPEVFARFRDNYLKFDRVEPKDRLSARPDLCALLLLDRLIPGTGNIIAASEHDELFIDVGCDKLARVAVEADILTLVRCGVQYNKHLNSLVMFS